MFYSYIVIIFLCFIAYSFVVIHEASALKEEETERYYSTKLQDISVVLDGQIMSGQGNVSSINTSSLIRKLYLNTLDDAAAIDSFDLYQALNEVKSIKASSSNLNIYEIVILFEDYNRAYSSSGVNILDENFQLPEQTPYIGSGSLQELLGVNSDYLSFYKDFLIYYDAYKYGTGSVKGIVCILFDKGSVEKLISSYLTDKYSLTMKRHEDGVVLAGEEKELSGARIFTSESSAFPGVYYELAVDKSEFSLGYNSFASLALGIGLLICAIYTGLAYFFSNKYYKPISNIENLIVDSAEKPRSDELNSIVDGVKNLLAERDDYRERMVTITPLAERGMLQEISKGNFSSENVEILNSDIYIGFQRLYYIAATVNIAFAADVHKIKKTLYGKVKALSNDDFLLTAFDQDFNNIHIVINSDNGEKLEDYLFKLYDGILSAMPDGVALTMGASEIQEDITRLYKACNDSVEALYNGMLLGGRSAVYFYEPRDENEKSDCYFPSDGVKIIVKALKERDFARIESFFSDIYNKNTKNEPSILGMELLLDELYITVVKVLDSINSICEVKIRIEKPTSATTFEDIIAYYKEALEAACGQILQTAPETEWSASSLDNDIIAYIDNNFCDSEISLSIIADKFDVSSKYITNLFKKKFAITYLQYVQEKRIAYAVKLLGSTSHSLDTICKACGYSSQLTFRRNFKSIMGVNPSDYRQS